MNGSRSPSSRPGERSSLDALSRTIEGLEARIEGMIGAAGRDVRTRPEQDALPARHHERHGERAAQADPLAEIRQRQRMLDASRERPPLRAEGPRAPAPVDPRAAAPAAARPLPAASPAAPPAPAPDAAMKEIAQALISLRQELKQDISEGVAREVGLLRSEIRSIKASASDPRYADEMREDLARLASSINQLGRQPAARDEAEGLRVEFEELRSLMDGLAREETMQRIEGRWDSVEDKIYSLDTISLHEELIALAYRLDSIKVQLGGMATNPAVQALEERLISVAAAMEALGERVQPNDHAIAEQFAGLDLRLDEISRAIVAGTRSSTSSDPALLNRLENRLVGLADQIDLMGRDTAGRPDEVEGLATRIEALTVRIEELANVEAAARLEERLEQLAMLLERSQKAPPPPELTGYLADISRKIDALDHGAVNDVLAERLDYLARRIDDMEFHAPAAAFDEAPFRRLEGRLTDIVARLDETAAAPAGDHAALRALEDQIAHLSALVSAPRNDAAGVPAQFETRMSALEDYMTTNDEYIIEAARQAAEAVVEAYSRNGAMRGAAPAADMSAISALADDLRHLEDLSRSSEERTHQTFEALHGTLVQIAERLDQMDSRTRAPAEPEQRFAPADPEPGFARRPPFGGRSFDARLDDDAGPPMPRAQMLDDLPAAPSFEHMPAEEAPRDDDLLPPPREKRPSTPKVSLLTGLAQRLLPRRPQPPSTGNRTVVEPTPPMSAEHLVSHEDANELLEPGSGAPDIKRILERVRASQNAERPITAAANDAERADYIAAARRAAQAAAQEVDPASRTAEGPNQGRGLGATIARHRRPILLAVGAILLVVMAMPLVNTLTRGNSASDSVESTSTLQAATPAADTSLPTAPPADAPAAVDGKPFAEPLTQQPATDGAAATGAPEEPAQSGALDTGHLTDTQQLAGDATSIGLSASGDALPAQATLGFAKEPEPALGNPQATTEPAASISVPEAVTPKSLADAASAGDMLALFEIGARYTEGRGVTADLAEAAKWYQLSADKGFAPAQYRLANLFEKGTGVAPDPAKAKEYYQRAADAGNASAMHNLAVLLATGTGGTPDYPAAVVWFTKAADLGVSDSQFNLAILLARGNGVPQNLEESYKWFAVAAKDGDKDAALKRDEVANAMLPAQLESARAKVDLWKAQPLNAAANAVDLPDAWVGKGLNTASVDMKKAIRNIQAILNNNGFNAGKPDGALGIQTVTAIKAFQKSVGMEPTGKINDALVKELLARNK